LFSGSEQNTTGSGKSFIRKLTPAQCKKAAERPNERRRFVIFAIVFSDKASRKKFVFTTKNTQKK
jgi:hypothetical protein